MFPPESFEFLVPSSEFKKQSISEFRETNLLNQKSWISISFPSNMGILYSIPGARDLS